MKFKIRFADQIVGLFIIVALAVLAFVIIMIGSRQRWFKNDPSYKTYFSSANGLSENMAVVYKGFTIGNVKSFELSEGDEVETLFSIYEEYTDRVKEGSLVELNVSPIGLGNSFVFYPGLGEDLVEAESFIPTVSSPQGQTYIQLGIASVPVKTDSINNILTQVDELTKSLNGVLVDVQSALQGSDATSLGRTLGSVEETITGLTPLPGTVDKTLADVNALIASLQLQLNDTLTNIQPILTDVNALTTKLNEPDGLVYSVLDTQGPIYTDLVNTINSLSGTIKNIDDTTKLLPGQLPVLLMDVRNTLKNVNDVLIALENNPLLKKGVPTQVETQSSGTNPRDVEF